MTQALVQRRFLITRPQNQAQSLAILLREAGAVPLLAPMIEIGDASQPQLLDAALARLSEFDLAVFISPTALDQIASRLNHWPKQLPAAVIGPASRERAQGLGISEIISPQSSYDSEGLLQMPALQNMDGKRVILFRGNGGRELLADTLRARGAQVEIVEAYRRLPPTIACEELHALLADGCDGVVVTSSEAVNNLFGLADDELANRLRGLLFFASHAAIAESARRAGVSRVLTTAAGDAGIVASLVECLAGQDHSEPPLPSTYKPPLPAKAAARQNNIIPFASGVLATAIAALLSFQYWRSIQPQQQSQMQTLEAQLLSLRKQSVQDDGLLRELAAQQVQQGKQLEDLRAQQDDFQTLYGAVAGDHEETLLADAELTLSLASQQLQLTGNLGATLSALYRLDERLAGHDKARLAPLRRALASDINTLKRLPWVDYMGLSARLDSLAQGVDQLPLLVDALPANDTPTAPASNSIWSQMGRSLGTLIQIRRIDQPEAMLLAPEQAFYLREQIKLRILNARLALLQRDEQTFRRDLQHAEEALLRRFDTRHRAVGASLASLREIRAQQPSPNLPTLADSLGAAREARRKVSKEEAK